MGLSPQRIELLAAHLPILGIASLDCNVSLNKSNSIIPESLFFNVQVYPAAIYSEQD